MLININYLINTMRNIWYVQIKMFLPTIFYEFNKVRILKLYIYEKHFFKFKNFNKITYNTLCNFYR